MAIELSSAHRRRLRQIWRSAGWPCQDMLEVELLDRGLLQRLRDEVNVPVIASLNGTSPGGWTDYARACEARGADAIELNTYFLATQTGVTGTELELSTYVAPASAPLGLQIKPHWPTLLSNRE